MPPLLPTGPVIDVKITVVVLEALSLFARNILGCQAKGERKKKMILALSYPIVGMDELFVQSRYLAG